MIGHSLLSKNVKFVNHIYDPEGEGAFKNSLRNFALTYTFNVGATFLCVGDFSSKNSLTPYGPKIF